MSGDLERRAEAVATELRRRVDTVHERQPCPKCLAPVGIVCRWASVRITYTRTGPEAVRRISPDRPLKHAHAERLRADGIADR